jgi:hypothetical protein
MRELTTDELVQVSGGTYDCCKCECPEPPARAGSNPGNGKPVGNAVKGTAFVNGADAGDGSGSYGMSSHPGPNYPGA